MLRHMYAFFFKSSVNKHCHYANICLSGSHIEFVQEDKCLSVLLNSSMDTSIDVSRSGTEILCTSQYAIAQLSLLWQGSNVYQEGQYVCLKNINRAIKNNTVHPRC